MNTSRISPALALAALAACTAPRIHLQHDCYVRAGDPLILRADVEPGSAILRGVSVRVGGGAPLEPGPMEQPSGAWEVAVPSARSLPAGTALDFTWTVDYGYSVSKSAGSIEEKGRIAITDPQPQLASPADGAALDAETKPGDSRAVVEVAWRDVPCNAGYRVRVRNQATGIADTHAAAVGATSLRVGGLARGATYEWSVCALFADPPEIARRRIQQGPWSAPATFTVR
jgi:hypothetical protein